MPTLHWIGKEKVMNHHADEPCKVLEHSYGFADGKQTTEGTGSGNKIIHGDNLEALKALLPEYEGRIKCIYIDSPYNTGNENWVYTALSTEIASQSFDLPPSIAPGDVSKNITKLLYEKEGKMNGFEEREINDIGNLNIAF